MDQRRKICRTSHLSCRQARLRMTQQEFAGRCMDEPLLRMADGFDKDIGINGMDHLYEHERSERIARAFFCNIGKSFVICFLSLERM